ncbi:MAG: hypothetical protein HRU20_30520 [Pseudomonadales bacterium]|nr:hypothetical protein [Pseudomonadales bacterium]
MKFPAIIALLLLLTACMQEPEKSDSAAISTSALSQLHAGEVYHFSGNAYLAEQDEFVDANLTKFVHSPKMIWDNELIWVETDIIIDDVAVAKINAAFYADSERPFITGDCSFVDEGDDLPAIAMAGDSGEGPAFICSGLEVQQSWSFLEDLSNAQNLIHREMIVRYIETDIGDTLEQKYFIDSTLNNDDQIIAVNIYLLVDDELQYIFSSDPAIDNQ